MIGIESGKDFACAAFARTTVVTIFPSPLQRLHGFGYNGIVRIHLSTWLVLQLEGSVHSVPRDVTLPSLDTNPRGYVSRIRITPIKAFPSQASNALRGWPRASSTHQCSPWHGRASCKHWQPQMRKWFGLPKPGTCRTYGQFGLALSSLDSGTSHASRRWRSWHCCKLPIAILVVGATRSACLQALTIRQRKQALTHCSRPPGRRNSSCS